MSRSESRQLKRSRTVWITFQRRGTASSVSVTSSPSLESRADPQHGQASGAARTTRSRGRCSGKGRREGRCVYYRVEPRGMKPLIDWIAHYRAFWAEHVGRLEQLLEKMDR